MKKKVKLTPEEKAEDRLIRKQWSQFLWRMRKIGAVVEEETPDCSPAGEPNSARLFIQTLKQKS